MMGLKENWITHDVGPESDYQCTLRGSHRTSSCAGPRIPDKAPKQFKAVVVKPFEDCHAMEIWIQGDNVVEVGIELINKLSLAFGVEANQITKLIEVDR
jgi:hypothetical protein